MSFTKILSPGIDTTSSYTIQELNSTGIATASTFVGPNGLDVNIGVDGGNFIVGGASTTVVVNGDVNTTGTISASTFVGDGSGITGVTASGTGIAIKDDGSIVGVAGTINFGTNLNVSPASAGIVTVTVGDSDFAINDKIVHQGDTDTAIRFPANNTFTVETAGSERVRVSSAGNVGIGTDSPAVALDVRNSSPILRLYDTDATNAYTNITNLSGNMYLGARDDSSNGVLLFGGYGGGTFTEYFRSSSTTFIIDTNQQERMRINSSGNVGIGTISPSTALHIAAIAPRIRIEDSDATGTPYSEIRGDSGNLFYNANQNAALGGDHIWSSGGASNELMRIDSSGNVGIGTDNPTELLHLSADSAHEILLKRGGGTPSEVRFANKGNLAVISNNTNGISFETGATPSEAMRIESSGNVGIGTDNPGQLLNLFQDGATDTVIQIQSGTANRDKARITKVNRTTGNGDLQIQSSSGANAHSIVFITDNSGEERMHIDSGGNVGIGTDNPGSLVHALGSYGTIRVENSNTAQYAASGVELKGPAGDERSTKIIHGNSNTGGTETYFQIEQYNAAGSYVKTLSQYSYEFDYWSFSTGGTQRLQITSDGSTYTGGSTITESDMNWTHNTYQRPHIFTGATGGNPSDGAVVVASPETEPSATRVGTIIFGCKTSSTTGVNNSGLKAAIDSNTNTNVSDAWKTGGDLRFKTRPDNGDLTERMRIHSNGCITKPSNPLLKVNLTSTYGAYQNLFVSPAVSIAQAAAEIDVGDNGWTTSGTNAYTFVCPVDGVYAVHAYISLSDIAQGTRVIWSMAYTLGGGNLPLSTYVEVIDTNVFDYQNTTYFDTWYFTAGTRVGMGINTNSGGSIAGHNLSWGMYLLQ